MTVPTRFRDKLKDWNKQEVFYKEDMKHANDNDVFRWSVFLKDSGECIGRVSCQENDKNNLAIRDVGWLIDPKYHKKGYGTEAAKAMIQFMFWESEIEELITGAAICNEASWKIMERLGFIRQKETKMVQYTFLDEPTEIYLYKFVLKIYIVKFYSFNF